MMTFDRHEQFRRGMTILDKSNTKYRVDEFRTSDLYPHVTHDYFCECVDSTMYPDLVGKSQWVLASVMHSGLVTIDGYSNG